MDKTNKLKNIKNYAVYYGADFLKELSKFDLAIIEPKSHSDENIHKLIEADTLVIGYISLIELNQESEIVSLLSEEDFLSFGDEKIMNKEFGNYLVDLRSQAWKSIVFNNIGNLIMNRRFDGIFIDTVADIEFFGLDKNLRKIQIAEYVDFLKDLRKYFGDIIIIQNNGVGEIIHSSAELIDGLMIENPDIEKDDNSVVLLNKIKKSYEVEIFVLFEESKNDLRDKNLINLSGENGFLVYKAPSNYVGGVGESLARCYGDRRSGNN